MPRLLNCAINVVYGSGQWAWLIHVYAHRGPIFDTNDKELLIHRHRHTLSSFTLLLDFRFLLSNEMNVAVGWKPIRIVGRWVVIIKTEKEKIFGNRFWPLFGMRWRTYERLRTTECDGIVMKADSLCVYKYELLYRCHVRKSTQTQIDKIGT